MENDIKEVLQEEAIEKDLKTAEMQANKANNVLQHEDDIKSRPKKTWFQNEKEKQASRLLGKPAEEKVDVEVKSSSEKQKEDMSKLTGRQKARMNDPYAGLSNKERRRKMAIVAEIKNEAKRELDEKFGEGHSVKVNKRDIENAKARIAAREKAELLIAKSIKKKEQQKLLGKDDDMDFIEPILGKRKPSNDHRYSKASYDPEAFENRYKDAGIEKEEAPKSQKPHRVKGSNQFKSKSKYKRR